MKIYKRRITTPKSNYIETYFNVNKEHTTWISGVQWLVRTGANAPLCPFDWVPPSVLPIGVPPHPLSPTHCLSIHFFDWMSTSIGCPPPWRLWRWTRTSWINAEARELVLEYVMEHRKLLKIKQRRGVLWFSHIDTWWWKTLGSNGRYVVWGRDEHLEQEWHL